MKVEHYSEKTLEIRGWPVHLRTYQIGGICYCKADNISPGADIARGSGATAEIAEQKAIAKATERLMDHNSRRATL